MRGSAILGIVSILIGLALLYLLRHLVIEVVIVLLGVIGIVIAVLLIVVGFALIFGLRFFRRGVAWRVTAAYSHLDI